MDFLDKYILDFFKKKVVNGVFEDRLTIKNLIYNSFYAIFSRNYTMVKSTKHEQRKWIYKLAHVAHALLNLALAAT